MDKLRQKVMNADFYKCLKRLIALALCVVLLGGGLSAVMLRTQIGEVITGVQQWERYDGFCASCGSSVKVGNP